MQKPNGYDEARATGEFTPVELGGHYCKIKQVSEVNSSTGKPMIVVLFDFCPPDKQNGYFSTIFSNDDRPDKKWPFAGTKYILVNDHQDPNKTSRQFKTFCTCIEKSNNHTITWGGSDWGKQFRNLQIGVIYGQEENEYDGKRFMRNVPKYLCRIDAVADAKIPDPKYLSGTSIPAAPSTAKPDVNGFLSVDDGLDDEEIPF